MIVRELETVVETTEDIQKLMERAVRAEGSFSRGVYDVRITADRFNLTMEEGLRTAQLGTVPFCRDVEAGSLRGVQNSENYTLANLFELIAFLLFHPEAVAEYDSVCALSEDSRWTDEKGQVLVPYAYVGGSDRAIHLTALRAVDFFRDHRSAVLVRRK
ncbi:hypothetical protein KJ885_05690 [Patescibacteria group bacterium]|nr:hypothetical protein [Patescibacteria group bacterium]